MSDPACAIHGGAGTIPDAAMNPALRELLPNGVMPELKKFYWDTALTFDRTALSSLLALTDSSKILFGTDFPFAPKFILPVEQKSLDKELIPEDLAAVLHGSALCLMPGLA